MDLKFLHKISFSKGNNIGLMIFGIVLAPYMFTFQFFRNTFSQTNLIPLLIICISVSAPLAILLVIFRIWDESALDPADKAQMIDYRFDQIGKSCAIIGVMLYFPCVVKYFHPPLSYYNAISYVTFLYLGFIVPRILSIANNSTKKIVDSLNEFSKKRHDEKQQLLTSIKYSTMRTYEEVLAELKAAGVKAQNGDFYEYEGFPLEDEFKKFFEVGQGFIDRDDLGFAIKPARIYYNTNTSINALAYLSKPYYLVEINKGTVFQLHEYYTSREDVFHQSMFANYKKFMDEKDISGSYVLFQFAMLFILYHEIGHLIQRNEEDPSYVEFFGGHVPGNTVKERHIREHDADWFGIGETAFHAIQFIDRGNPGNHKIDPHELSIGVEMMLAAVYMFFIRQAEGNSAFYLEEKTHPHPSVRISYIIMYLLDAVTENTAVKLDQRQVLKNAIQLAEALLIEPGGNTVEEFSKGIFTKIDEITAYINKIRNDSEAYPHLARKKIKSVVYK